MKKPTNEDKKRMAELFEEFRARLDDAGIPANIRRGSGSNEHDTLHLEFSLQQKPYWVYAWACLDGAAPSLMMAAGHPEKVQQAKPLAMLAVSMIDHHCSTDDAATAVFCIQRYWAMRDPD